MTLRPMTMFPKALEKAPGVPTALFDGVAEARTAAERLATTGMDRGTILIPEDGATPGAARGVIRAFGRS